MYPPLNHTHLYVEIKRDRGDNSYHCNQSYEAIRDAAINGMPIEGYILQQDSNDPLSASTNREGGCVSRINIVSVSDYTKRIAFYYGIILFDDDQQHVTIANTTLFMKPDNTFTNRNYV